MRSATRAPGRVARFALAAAVLLLAGCSALIPQTIALRTDWPAGVPRQLELTQVPFFPQAEFQCGPAALAMAMAYAGASVRPEALVGEVWLPARQGSLQREMLAAPRRHGLVGYPLAPSYADLLRELAAGHPVLVLQDVGPVLPEWHYAVVNGFDYASGTLLLRSGLQARQEMPFSYFERTWRAGGYWAMVVTRADEIPATATESRWREALAGLSRAGAGEVAVGAWRAALARWPHSLAVAVGLANALHAAGALQEAVRVLQAALRRFPQSEVLMNNLAQTLSDQGRHAEALAVIEHARDPLSPFAGEVRSTRALIEQRLR